MIRILKNGFVDIDGDSVPCETEIANLHRNLDDWWIGYFRGEKNHYICPLPTLVIAIPRRGWR